MDHFIRRPSGLLVPPEPRIHRPHLCDLFGGNMMAGSSLVLVLFKLWAAGGGAGWGGTNPTGGGAGYVEFSALLASGTAITIEVGVRGWVNGYNYSRPYPAGGGENYLGGEHPQGGQGGGRSGIRIGATYLGVAGGGGGGGVDAGKGGAGGPSGQDGGSNMDFSGLTSAGRGATSTSGGAGGYGDGADGQSGAALQGGNAGFYSAGSSTGAGGGDGWYGGGGSNGYRRSGAGGGSNYINSALATAIQNLGGNWQTQANASDPDCGGAGLGSPGSANPGNHGKVVIYINSTQYVFNATGADQTLITP
ncbi:hypothetical protein E6C67_26775 [Azospirillum sp. TSA2s]|uniref:hypothetical protein n=1 Tax=Azospirillum sp. TSA2s TaxID=709810 RepID=UPI0010AAD298|nr:hypothetical protein [Azospirillum sp. TSA2s]QCG97380.1 hypothetical protein E6C67_26775 [Azospirillum sp. TSA2s]